MPRGDSPSAIPPPAADETEQQAAVDTILARVGGLVLQEDGDPEEATGNPVPAAQRQEAKGVLARNPDITFSLWDYGGQDVFLSLHHLFLTRFGVYVVVFDMTLLAGGRLSGGTAEGAKAMRTIRFWLSTIAVHSQRQGEAGGTAPIVLVGTHKDDRRVKVSGHVTD